MRFIDLFAGLGGFHLALEELGHDCVFASEINETLRDTYEKNFGLRPEGDIRRVKASDIPKHDILCAGFPCQSFSKAGAQAGLKDKERGQLFYEILRIIEYHKPQYILLENVPNIRKHDSGETWKEIQRQLEKHYHIDVREFSPHHFGIPQVRLRTYIVGSRHPLTNFEWPAHKTSNITVIDLLEKTPDGSQKIPAQMKDCLNVWQEFLDKVPSDQKIPHPLWAMEFGATYPYKGTTPHSTPHWELVKHRGSFGAPFRGKSKQQMMKELPSHAIRKEQKFPNWKVEMIRRNREFYRKNKAWIDEWKPKISAFRTSFQKLEWNCQGSERKISKYIIQFRASGVRVKQLTTAPALIAMTSTQVPIIGWEGRFMTPNECKKLQSMNRLKHLPPSNGRAYEALGNAVNVKVVKLVATALLHPNRQDRELKCPVQIST